MSQKTAVKCMSPAKNGNTTYFDPTEFYRTSLQSYLSEKLNKLSKMLSQEGRGKQDQASIQPVDEPQEPSFKTFFKFFDDFLLFCEQILSENRSRSPSALIIAEILETEFLGAFIRPSTKPPKKGALEGELVQATKQPLPGIISTLSTLNQLKVEFMVRVAVLKYYYEALVKAPVPKFHEKFQKRLHSELERAWDRLLIKMKMEQQDFVQFFCETPLKFVKSCPSLSFIRYIRGVFEKYESRALLDELSLIEEEMRNKTHIKLSGKIRTKSGNEVLHSSSMTIIQKKTSSFRLENSNDTRSTRDTSSSGKYKSDGLWSSFANEEFNRKISVTNFIETALNENSNLSNGKENFSHLPNQLRNKPSPPSKYDRVPSDRRSQPILRDLDAIKISREDDRKSDSNSVVTDASSQFFLFNSQNENMQAFNNSSFSGLMRAQSQPVKLGRAASLIESEGGQGKLTKLEASVSLNGTIGKSLNAALGSSNNAHNHAKKPNDNGKKGRSFGNSFSRKLVNLPNQRKLESVWPKHQANGITKSHHQKEVLRPLPEEDDYIPCNLLTIGARGDVLAWGTPVKSCKDSLSSDGDERKVYKNLIFD